MQHLDFSRAFMLAAREKNIGPQVTDIVAHLKEAQKFILPPDGILMDDKELRGLNEEIPLSLPFETTVLEWPGTGNYSKVILVLRQLADDIELQPVVYDSRTKKWGWQPAVFIDRHRYINREEDGRVAYFIRHRSQESKDFGDATGVYHKFAVTFLSFCNALSCKNVDHERSPPGAVRSARRTPIPYDSYRVLTFSGTRTGGRAGTTRSGIIHASPREHLRRGHIVRMKTCSYWRQATVVMAGSEGKVDKSYRLRA